jgi:hypothetical protein
VASASASAPRRSQSTMRAILPYPAASIFSSRVRVER